MKKALLIFLRYPAPGKVKKRLSEAVGAQKAAEIYEKLLRRTLGIACDLKRKSPEINITLFFTPRDPLQKLMDKFKGPWEFRPQRGAHLGERMANALRWAFEEGAGRAVLIGSDLADVESQDIEEAFLNLGEKVAVLGPAADGGFYLVGTARPVEPPFDFSTWGTNEVFSRTAREFEAEGFRVHLAPVRHDVDRQSDLKRPGLDSLLNDCLSIIIPTLSEAEKLSPLLRYLEDLLWPGDEIVLAQGAGFAKTALHRVSPVLTIVKTAKGRGIQQNVAAMLSREISFSFCMTTPSPRRSLPTSSAGPAGKTPWPPVLSGCAFCPQTVLLTLSPSGPISGPRSLSSPTAIRGIFAERLFLKKREVLGEDTSWKTWS